MGAAGRSRWAAIGAAIAVVMGAGGVSWVGATISSGTKAVFVPITPCRLADTRPGGPGTRDTPLTAAETATFTVRGSNGNCNIPAGATAISGNATITDPTDDGFMTIAPAGGVGTSSNINWLVGQSPTPNAFTVALSGDGKIDVYNDRGTVNVVIDVNGYYEDHDHDDRYYTKAQTDTALAQVPTVVPMANSLAAPPVGVAQSVLPIAGAWSVTLARSGPVLVNIVTSASVSCTSGSTAIAWLAIDNTSQSPTSQTYFQAGVFSTLVFSEIVNLSAGTHDIKIALKCFSGTVGATSGGNLNGWVMHLGSSTVVPAEIEVTG